MSTYTLEGSEKPIACICAEDRSTAAQTVAEPWFRENLVAFTSKGQPLWNGQAQLILRDPTPKEHVAVQKRIGASNLTDSPLDEDRAILFLVPLDDPALSHHHMEVEDDGYPV